VPHDQARYRASDPALESFSYGRMRQILFPGARSRAT
jgi:hypothetical protein